MGRLLGGATHYDPTAARIFFVEESSSFTSSLSRSARTFSAMWRNHS